VGLDELHEAARAREPGAWEALGRGLFVELRRFFGNCFDRSTAEELTQTTILVVIRKLDQFQPIGPHAFRNWVLAIAGRQARAHAHKPRRERARRSKLDATASPTPMCSPTADSPVEELLRRERLELITECLSHLPEAHRRALESDLAGDDYRELADREGISVGGVRVRRHRALAQLRQLVAARSTPNDLQQ
jgi:RNA polymerase sigma factor (sigma-70 family)